MQGFGQILSWLLLDLHAVKRFLNFHYFSLGVRVVQNTYWMKRTNYIDDGFSQALSDLKDDSFSPSLLVLLNIVMFSALRTKHGKNGLKDAHTLVSCMEFNLLV